MSKKPRNKKYNPNKRAQKVFSNTRLWSWSSMTESDNTAISHGETKVGMVWKQLNQKQVAGIAKNTNNWTICCRAYCREPLIDTEWIESLSCSIRDSKINELHTFYKELKIQLINELKEKDLLPTVIDIGWLIHSFDSKERIDTPFELAHSGTFSKERQNKFKELNPDL